MVNSPYMAFSPYVCHNNKENLVFHAYIQSVAVTPKEDFIIMTDKTQNRQFRIRQWAASEQIHDIIKNVMEAYHITAGEAMDVLKIPQPKREYYSEHILHDA